MNFSRIITTLFLIITLMGKSQCLISGLSSSYCVNDAPASLTTAVPGGTLSGSGITNSIFDPSVAGVGTHSIEYNYCSLDYSVSSISYTNIGNGWYTIPQLNDNEMSAALPIGFTFKFFCDTFSNVYISSNGFVTFSAGQSAGCCQGMALPTTAGPKNSIALCWTDLDPSLGGSIRYELFGTPPNRIFMINYNCIFHKNNGNGGDPITGCILLYETSNIIELHLGVKPVPVFPINSTSGIQDASGTIGYAVPGRNGNSSWGSSCEGHRFIPGPSCAVTATTTVLNNPTVTVSSDRTSICKDESVILTAFGADTYSWSNAAQNNSIVVQPLSTSIYSVTGTLLNGCSASNTIHIKVQQCSFIPELETSALEIFPNPSQGLIKIKYPSDQTFEIYNSIGQKIKTVSLKAGIEQELDLTALPAGQYFILDLGRKKKYPFVIIK